MAFGKCGCVLNREVKNNTAEGSARQDRGCHKMSQAFLGTNWGLLLMVVKESVSLGMVVQAG